MARIAGIGRTDSVAGHAEEGVDKPRWVVDAEEDSHSVVEVEGTRH